MVSYVVFEVVQISFDMQLKHIEKICLNVRIILIKTWGIIWIRSPHKTLIFSCCINLQNPIRPLTLDDPQTLIKSKMPTSQISIYCPTIDLTKLRTHPSLLQRGTWKLHNAENILETIGSENILEIDGACTLIIQINHMQFSCRNRLWNSFSKMRSNGTENESMLDILTHAWIYWLWRLNSSLVSKLRNFLYQKIIIRLWTFVLELHPKSICTTAAWLVLPWQILHHGIAKQPTIPLVTFIGI